MKIGKHSIMEPPGYQMKKLDLAETMIKILYDIRSELIIQNAILKNIEVNDNAGNKSILRHRHRHYHYNRKKQ